MRELEIAALTLLFAGLSLFTGCATRPIIVGCLDQKPYRVEGPVIINEKSVMFHDDTGKLHKVEGTCGIKAVKED